MADRPVEELALLDTYQGMTDSEIESLIEYRVTMGLQNAEFMAELAVRQAESDAVIASHQAMYEYSRNLLDTLCANPPVLETVVHDE